MGCCEKDSLEEVSLVQPEKTGRNSESNDKNHHFFKILPLPPHSTLIILLFVKSHELHPETSCQISPSHITPDLTSNPCTGKKSTSISGADQNLPFPLLFFPRRVWFGRPVPTCPGPGTPGLNTGTLSFLLWEGSIAAHSSPGDDSEASSQPKPYFCLLHRYWIFSQSSQLSLACLPKDLLALGPKGKTKIEVIHFLLYYILASI